MAPVLFSALGAPVVASGPSPEMSSAFAFLRIGTIPCCRGAKEMWGPTVGGSEGTEVGARNRRPFTASFGERCGAGLPTVNPASLPSRLWRFVQLAPCGRADARGVTDGSLARSSLLP